ncbi:phenylacetate--CoA ligase family protein [Lentisalinibacter sediminis]|uniref:phenylacetate--CoA ligase family protein n=1 Tax=Lentisalinibacter sediminis TaxID=2992237 RepID=UPI003865D66B
MNSFSEKLYASSPVLAQHVLVSAYGYYWKKLRLSQNFHRERDAFISRERFSHKEWEQYQNAELRKLLVTAFDHVPYYQKAWRGLVTRADLERFTVGDLPALPIVEKSAVRDDPDAFLVGGSPQKLHRINYTSGSSGTPVSTYWLPGEMQRSIAMREARSCRFAGVSYSQSRATFSGRKVVPSADSQGPFYRYNWFEKQLYFSAFHISPSNAEKYIEAFERHRPYWMTGYANSIYQIAKLAAEKGLQPPSLKAVITTSEPVSSEMRSVIEAVFRTRVFEEYGTVENLFFVCENEYGQKLINPDCGILEVVNSTFDQIGPAEDGEILATGFIRPSQPMIRYRIGDRAVLSEERARCGRQMPVLKEVIGRLEDTVYGPDGRRMVRFHGIFVDQPNIEEGQIIQERLDFVRVIVVAKPGFGFNDEQDVIKRIKERLGDGMRVVVEQTSAIPRNQAGKFRAVISKISERSE